MSKIEGKNLFYVKDLKTGNILSINVRGGKSEIAKKNRDLEKKGQKHLIRHVVLSDEEVEKYEKSLNPVEKKPRVKKI